MSGNESVEFKTLDGLKLMGRLYPTIKRGAGIIITPGVCQLHLQLTFSSLVISDQH
jgi:hypothetical protein